MNGFRSRSLSLSHTLSLCVWKYVIFSSHSPTKIQISFVMLCKHKRFSWKCKFTANTNTHTNMLCWAVLRCHDTDADYWDKCHIFVIRWGCMCLCVLFSFSLGRRVRVSFSHSLLYVPFVCSFSICKLYVPFLYCISGFINPRRDGPHTHTHFSNSSIFSRYSFYFILCTHATKSKNVCVHEIVRRNDYCAIRNMFGWVGNTHTCTLTQREDDIGGGERRRMRWVGGWSRTEFMLGRIYAVMNGLQMRDICKQIYSNIHLFECVCFFPLILSITTGIMNMAYSLVFTLSLSLCLSFVAKIGFVDTQAWLSFINSESNNIQLGRTV